MKDQTVMRHKLNLQLSLMNVIATKNPHLASNLIFAWRSPSSFTTSTQLSGRRDEVEALTMRSARLWMDVVESCLETEGVVSKDGGAVMEGERIGDTQGDILLVVEVVVREEEREESDTEQ